MIDLIGPISTAAAVGGNGVATGNVVTPNRVIGKLMAVHIAYLDSPPAATADVTIATQGTDPAPPAQTILTISNSATDAWYSPRLQVHTNLGAGATLDGTRPMLEPVVLHDKLVITLAQANANDYVTVWLLVEK